MSLHESTPVTIRTAADAEMSALARLAAKLVRQHHEMDPGRFMIFESIEPGYRRYLSSELSNADAVVLAAIRTGPGGVEEVIGYAYGRLEPRDEIERRIEEATKYIGLDQLCLSPQCGFASTDEGNLLAQNQQWAKLRMIVELSQEIWGK